MKKKAPTSPSNTPLKVLPKILIDSRMIHGTPHGIALYLLELLQGLLQVHAQKTPPYEIVLLVHPQEIHHPVFKNFKIIPAKSTFLNPKEFFEIPSILSKEKIALYHSPSFSSLIHAPCPWLVTVHDLNHLHFGNVFQKAYYYLFLKPFIKKAKKVMTVSKFSRKEISNWTGLPLQDMDIVYNPVDCQSNAPLSNESQTILEKNGLEPNRFFLSVGNSKPHKNTAMLLSAYQQFLKTVKDPRFPLVLTHGIIPDALKKNVIALENLNQNDIYILMKNCSAFLSPSLYEGFGRTPLEAALCGAKVICSDIEPHHELWNSIKNFPLFLDPHHTEAWSQALCEVYQNILSPQKEKSKSPLRTLTEEEVQFLEKTYLKKTCAEKLDYIYTRMIQC